MGTHGQVTIRVPAAAGLDGWIDRAACRGEDPELWQPIQCRPGSPAVRAAVAICQGCPVRAECLEAALSLSAHDDQWGIWGGLTPQERDRIRRDRAAGRKPPAACGTLSGHDRHRRHRGEPCEPCREAMRAYHREYNRRRRANR